jgi:hypothetical protein
MSIPIVISCIFGITPGFPGEVRSAPMRISSAEYERIRYEEGNDRKIRLCRKKFGLRADLAWFETDETGKDSPESGG